MAVRFLGFKTDIFFETQHRSFFIKNIIVQPVVRAPWLRRCPDDHKDAGSIPAATAAFSDGGEK